MERKHITSSIAAAAAIAIVSSLHPAYADRLPSGSPSLPAPAHGSDMRMSRILGMEVRNRQGDTVGEVEDLIIDTHDGKVRFAVLEAGGFLGVGEHRTAVPISRMRATYDKQDIVTDLSVDELRRFPSYPPGEHPDWNDAAFLGQFGDRSLVASTPANAYGEKWTGHRLRRASDLLDAQLRDRDGWNIGEVRDMVLNLDSGKVKYGVAKLATRWADDDRLVVIHPRDVRLGSDDGLVVVSNRQTLRSAPTVREDRWEDFDINAAAFRARVDRDERYASRD